MKAIVYQPKAGEGEVRVRVRAASVDPADGYLMKGAPLVARAQMGLRGPKTGRLGSTWRAWSGRRRRCHPPAGG